MLNHWTTQQCDLQMSRKMFLYSVTQTTLQYCLVGYEKFPNSLAQPSECGRQRTLNIVHAQIAAQQQSNGSYEARMSRKYREWRD